MTSPKPVPPQLVLHRDKQQEAERLGDLVNGTIGLLITLMFGISLADPPLREKWGDRGTPTPQ